jgi:hypothetical protein
VLAWHLYGSVAGFGSLMRGHPAFQTKMKNKPFRASLIFQDKFLEIQIEDKDICIQKQIPWALLKHHKGYRNQLFDIIAEMRMELGKRRS